jgi:hypothetical protein
MSRNTLQGWNEQPLMAWVAEAGMNDLRWAQNIPLNSSVLAAIQARIGHLETMAVAASSAKVETQHYRIGLAISILTLIAAIGALLVGAIALLR